MKARIYTSALLLLSLFTVVSAKGQIGWKWAKGAVLYSATSSGSGEGGWVTPDKAGGAFIATNAPGYDSMRFDSILLGASAVTSVLIARTDASGNYVWVKSTKNAYAEPVAVTSDMQGNLFVFGWYTTGALKIDGFTLTTTATSASFLLKVSRDGTVLWARNISNNGGLANDGGMFADNSGNIYLTSTYSSPTLTVGTTTLINKDHTGITHDQFIVKFTTSGDFVWAKDFGTAGDDVVFSIAQGGPGYFYFSGNIPQDSSISFGTITLTGPHNSFYAKSDTDGNIIWARNLDANGYIKRLNNGCSDDLYMIGGYYNSIVLGPSAFTSAGGVDIFIAKADSDGNLLWGNSAGGSDWEAGFSLTTDLCGKLWVCGKMGSNPGSGISSMSFNGRLIYTPSGSSDPAFLAEYDTSGNFVDVMAFASGSDDILSVVADNAGSILFAGDYVGTQMQFGPFTMDTVTPGGGECIFIAKYTYDTIRCSSEIPSLLPHQNERPDSNIITIYPNPSSYEWTISATADFPASSIVELYDLTGRLVNKFALYGSKMTISVAGLTSGMYQCRIISGNGQVVVKKLVAMK